VTIEQRVIHFVLANVFHIRYGAGLQTLEQNLFIRIIINDIEFQTHADIAVLTTIDKMSYAT